jgi:GntR family transcriptional repressor for pyruvate dehydrogenase complex
MIRPRVPRSSMSRAAAWPRLKHPVRLTSRWAFHCSSVMSRKGADSTMPALPTATSRGSTERGVCSSVERSRTSARRYATDPSLRDASEPRFGFVLALTVDQRHSRASPEELCADCGAEVPGAPGDNDTETVQRAGVDVVGHECYLYRGLTGKTSLGVGLSRDALASRLEEELAGNGVQPGTKLPSERQLAVRFGVSRPFVREALRSLVERGLIEISPGRGAFVRAMRMSDAARPLDAIYRRQKATPRDLVEARLMLEREAAGLAAERAEPDELDAMERVLERFDRTSDLIERARYDIAFHALIARMSHNPVIETMFSSIASLTFELMLRSLSDPAVAREGLPYHREIADAIRDGDPDRAREAIEGHLLIARRLYGQDLDRGLDLVARRELERVFGHSVSLEAIVADVGLPADKQ